MEIVYQLIPCTLKTKLRMRHINAILLRMCLYVYKKLISFVLLIDVCFCFVSAWNGGNGERRGGREPDDGEQRGRGAERRRRRRRRQPGRLVRSLDAQRRQLERAGARQVVRRRPQLADERREAARVLWPVRQGDRRAGDEGPRHPGDYPRNPSAHTTAANVTNERSRSGAARLGKAERVRECARVGWLDLVGWHLGWIILHYIQ
jgi:hypothetical protein